MKLLTWVNKGRVQVEVVALGQQGQGKHYNYKNQFSQLEGSNMINSSFTVKKTDGETEEISFSGRIWK